MSTKTPEKYKAVVVVSISMETTVPMYYVGKGAVEVINAHSAEVHCAAERLFAEEHNKGATADGK